MTLDAGSFSLIQDAAVWRLTRERASCSTWATYIAINRLRDSAARTTQRAISEAIAVHRNRVGDAVKRLHAWGLIDRDRDGWKATKLAPRDLRKCPAAGALKSPAAGALKSPATGASNARQQVHSMHLTRCIKSPAAGASNARPQVHRAIYKKPKREKPRTRARACETLSIFWCDRYRSIYAIRPRSDQSAEVDAQIAALIDQGVEADTMTKAIGLWFDSPRMIERAHPLRFLASDLPQLVAQCRGAAPRDQALCTWGQLDPVARDRIHRCITASNHKLWASQHAQPIWDAMPEPARRDMLRDAGC